MSDAKAAITDKSSFASKQPPAISLTPRLFPGAITLSIVALCVVVIVVLRTLPSFEGMPSPLNDMALANILTGQNP